MKMLYSAYDIQYLNLNRLGHNVLLYTLYLSV